MGQATVAGWAFDDVSVTKVEIMVDGGPRGVANYRIGATGIELSRPSDFGIFIGRKQS